MTHHDASVLAAAHSYDPARAPASRWPEGLRLRRRVDRDAGGLYALLSQDDFQRNANTLDPFTSIDDLQAFSAAAAPHNLEIVATVDDTIVGFVGIYVLPGRQAHVGSFTLGVHEGFQRRGIGMLLMRALVGAAFGPMGLARLQAMVFADNTRALSLYRRSGFAIEGRLARFVRREDGFVDAFLIASVPLGSTGSETMQ
jgi:putative acetyltransferase